MEYSLMLGSKILSFLALATIVPLAQGYAVAQVSPAATVKAVTLTCNQQRRFIGPVNALVSKDATGTWMVAGVPGGNDQVGTITADGVYTAPRMAPGSDVEIAVADPATGRSRVIASVSVVEDPAVEEAHAQWLAGVAAAAAQHGCSPNLVLQSPTESVADAVKIYLQVASEHTCLVLQPVSSEAGSMRYSFSSGGEVDGVNILYLSDVSRMRIWNGKEIRPN
jgi:hypothetical protein